MIGGASQGRGEVTDLFLMEQAQGNSMGQGSGSGNLDLASDFRFETRDKAADKELGQKAHDPIRQ